MRVKRGTSAMRIRYSWHQVSGETKDTYLESEVAGRGGLMDVLASNSHGVSGVPNLLPIEK